MDQETAEQRLRDLGARAWETNPPAEGLIRFLDEHDERVASGRYQVIGSYGPGERFTMGWSIGTYRANGIPFVERTLAAGPAEMVPATRAAAWKRGLVVLKQLPGAFLYWCDTLLVAVTQLEADPAPATAPQTADRIEGVARAVARQQEPTDTRLDGSDKRALLGEISGLLPTDEQRTSTVFVIEANEQEIEMSRDHVGAADLAFFARIYWMLPTWEQRTCLILLVQDHGDTVLREAWIDILRAPDRGAMTGRHIAKATALAHLRGDISEQMDYLDDYARTLAHAATWSKTPRPVA